MNINNMLKPALIGGMALGILSALPYIGSCNCVCCAWVIGGGVLAAYLYVKDSPTPVTMGRGAVVGLAAGAIGAVVYFLFGILLKLILIGGEPAVMLEQIRKGILEGMEKNPAATTELRQSMEALFLSDVSIVLAVIFTVFVGIVCFSVFAMLGGTIGVAIFEKRKPGNFQPDATPPQPLPQPPQPQPQPQQQQLQPPPQPPDIPPPDNF